MKIYLFSPGPVSYRGGLRFKDKYPDVPGPGSYSPPSGLGGTSSMARLKGGKFGFDARKSMELKETLGKKFSFSKNSN